jgi:hypothetical protein
MYSSSPVPFTASKSALLTSFTLAVATQLSSSETYIELFVTQWFHLSQEK